MSAAKWQHCTRREFLSGSTALGLSAACILPVGNAAATPDKERVYRVGVINAARGNLHSWHFFQAFHSSIDMDALAKNQRKQMGEMYRKWLRNPQVVGAEPPFLDTRITHVFDKDAEAAGQFAEVFSGVRPVKKVEQMVREVDAVLLGDAIGNGEDHFDLIAPALEAGLPTFCDKPLADKPTRAAEILSLAEKHGTPLMSSSLFRHFAEVLHVARLRETGEFGKLQWLTVGYGAACIDNFIPVYAIHPVWAVAAICGVGFEGASLVRYEGSCLLTITFQNRPPATVWMGGDNQGTAHFSQKSETFALFGSDSGNVKWHARYSRTVAHLVQTIREMIRSKRQPFSSRELLEVVAATHAAIKSVQENGRVVALEEVL